MPEPPRPADDHSRYVNLPELSVDGLHASETLNGVTAVTRKFPGVVGLVLSIHHAYAGKTNNSAKTIPVKPAFIRKLLSSADLYLIVIKTPFLTGHLLAGEVPRLQCKIHEPHNRFPGRPLQLADRLSALQ